MKGSKYAVIKLVLSSNFLDEMNSKLITTGAKINIYDNWIPKSIKYDKEAELNDFLKYNFSPELGIEITNWWLHKDTTTPNWDLISTCNINGKRGIVLVETKAHYDELKIDKKKEKADPSEGTKANLKQIIAAIAEANTNIEQEVNGICLSTEKCYQFSNRVAHAWWLASQGIPVVLLYLGFLNVEDMADKYTTFKKAVDWENCFIEHVKVVGAEKLINKTIDCGKSSFVTICRSIKV